MASKREAERAAADRLNGRTLIITDRENGAVERISDGNMVPSIYSMARHMDWDFAQAVDRLLAGEVVKTAGFLRQLEPLT